eukprot:gene28036-31137_t
MEVIEPGRLLSRHSWVPTLVTVVHKTVPDFSFATTEFPFSLLSGQAGPGWHPAAPIESSKHSNFTPAKLLSRPGMPGIQFSTSYLLPKRIVGLLTAANASPTSKLARQDWTLARAFHSSRDNFFNNKGVFSSGAGRSSVTSYDASSQLPGNADGSAPVSELSSSMSQSIGLPTKNAPLNKVNEPMPTATSTTDPCKGHHAQCTMAGSHSVYTPMSQQPLGPRPPNASPNHSYGYSHSVYTPMAGNPMEHTHMEGCTFIPQCPASAISEMGRAMPVSRVLALGGRRRTVNRGIGVVLVDSRTVMKTITQSSTMMGPPSTMGHVDHWDSSAVAVARDMIRKGPRHGASTRKAILEAYDHEHNFCGY